MTLEGTSVKNVRHSSRDKSSRDGQRPDSHGEKRESRPVATQHRRSVKDDSDLWSSVRQQRGSGQDGSERPHRRNGDREHDEEDDVGRERRVQRGYDNYRKDGDEATNAARIGPGKVRHDPSRYRDEGYKDRDGGEAPDNTKPRDWRDKERRGNRGAERDWNRGAKAELEPEWMDEPEPEPKDQKRTQEDFERWKERMKASNGATQDTPLSQPEPPSNNDRTASGAGNGTVKSKVDAPLIVDPSLDGFFGLWDKPQKDLESTGNIGIQAQPNISGNAVKVSKPSKFTGFFAPKVEPEPPKEQLALPFFEHSKDSSKEDKEGFQRILKLLDQQQPQNGKAGTPPRGQAPREMQTATPVQSPRAEEQNDLFNLLDKRSPQEKTAPPTRDGEFLLRLMQQPQQTRQDLNQINLGGRRVGQGNKPGSLPFANPMIPPHDTPTQTPSNGPPPGLFSGEEIHIRDKLNPNSGIDRRGLPPGMPPQQSGFPPGFPSSLQRPPGLDYAQHIQSQRMVPPPGFQAPARGQGPFPPGLVPGNLNDRVQFSISANGRGMPPPGFIGMNAPPPGFALPFNQEGMPYAGFGDAASFGQGAQGFFPGQQRRQ